MIDRPSYVPTNHVPVFTAAGNRMWVSPNVIAASSRTPTRATTNDDSEPSDDEPAKKKRSKTAKKAKRAKEAKRAKSKRAKSKAARAKRIDARARRGAREAHAAKLGRNAARDIAERSAILAKLGTTIDRHDRVTAKIARGEQRAERDAAICARLSARGIDARKTARSLGMSLVELDAHVSAVDAGDV
jgi:hypothetical protein